MNSSLFYLFLGMTSALFVSYAVKLDSPRSVTSEPFPEGGPTLTNVESNRAPSPESSEETTSLINSTSENSGTPSTIVVISILPTDSAGSSAHASPSDALQTSHSRSVSQADPRTSNLPNQSTYAGGGGYATAACNSTPNHVYLRTQPGAYPGTILGVMQPEQWVQFTGHVEFSEGKAWYQVISPQLTPSVYPGAINRLESGQVGWIDSCSLFTQRYR